MENLETYLTKKQILMCDVILIVSFTIIICLILNLVMYLKFMGANMFN